MELQPLDTLAVWEILSKISLSQAKQEMLRKSFRTRAKPKEDVLDFQFKFLPGTFTEEELPRLEEIKEELKHSLTAHFPNEKIDVTLKIAECCGEVCFCCEEIKKKMPVTE